MRLKFLEKPYHNLLMAIVLHAIKSTLTNVKKYLLLCLTTDSKAKKQ